MSTFAAAARPSKIRRLPRPAMRLERRREGREEASGVVSATYRNGGDRFGVTYLELTDRSASGMGVRTRTRLEPGMTVTICPEGSTVPWLATTVARCEADADGFYRAGLTFSSRIAA